MRQSRTYQQKLNAAAAQGASVGLAVSMALAGLGGASSATAAPASAAGAADVGMITFLKGKATVEKPGHKASRITAMQTFDEGSHINIAANGQATILLFHNGARFSLSSNSKIVIAKDGCRAVSGPAPKQLVALNMGLVKVLLKSRAPKSRAASGPSATTVIRTVPIDIELQSLCVTATLDPHPVFIWRPADGAVSYKVRLKDKDDEIIWQIETTATELIYPADAPPLKADIDYMWTVSTIVHDERKSSDGIFRILGPARRAAVQTDLEALQGIEDEMVAGALRAEIYQGYNLQDDALVAYQELVTRFPDVAALRIILAEMLEMRGRRTDGRAQLEAAKQLAATDEVN